MQTAITDEVSNESFKSARSVCAMSRSVVRIVLFSPDHSPTCALDVSCPAGNVSNNPKINLTVTTPDCRRKAYRVTTCRLRPDTRFWSRPLQYTLHSTWGHTYKHQTCSSRTLLETTTSVTSRCHRSIILPSRVHPLGGSAVSQPHHCFPQWLSSVFPTSSMLPQWLASNQFVGGRLGNHYAASRE